MLKCPVCKEENNCAVAKKEEPTSCWCMKVTIPKELLEKASIKDHCICEKCVEDYRLTLEKMN
ncbi:cysteine-rich CWC family protein [Sutcliffiella halmapala]|uniref:cysteine-rich CWC family protein n=1 Tax=Sutcliffiella halmapala TaxID=79882 RepID=UPI000994AE90|nr:cysteine-rich CWC family protein [Sutcliffiella halmapala]